MQELKDGIWYLVRYELLNGDNATAPAMYKHDAKAFYSYLFSGIPTRQVTVIREIDCSTENKPLPTTSNKLAGWIMTADDDCGADWFEFVKDHPNNQPAQDAFFRPVPVFFGKSKVEKESEQAQANLNELLKLHAEAWSKAKEAANAAAKQMREVAELLEAEGIAPALREKARTLELVMNLPAVQQPAQSDGRT